MITGSDEYSYVKHNRTIKPRVYDAFKRAFARQNIHFEKGVVDAAYYIQCRCQWVQLGYVKLVHSAVVGRQSQVETSDVAMSDAEEGTTNDWSQTQVVAKPKQQRSNNLRPHLRLYSDCLDLAIQSLDSLNDQIVQFIFAPKTCDYDEDVDFDESIQPKQREALKSSMALMRCLLLDAQGKFRKMVDDNKQLAERIDGDIQTAQQDVSVLRAELADTNRRINQLSPNTDNGVGSPTQNVLCRNCNSFYHPDDNQLTEEVASLKTESDKLNQENINLQKEIEKLKKFKEQFSTGERDNDQSLSFQKLEEELEQAKETVNSLKTDRKRLKAEKFDLLNQMKQLYGTLEDKEKELRDFIRNYEQRVKESDESIKQLTLERDSSEREKWSILKHARDESERSVSLCSQLSLKESQLQQVQEELNEARKQLSQLGYYSDQESLASRSNGYHTSTTLTSINANGRDHTPTSLGTASVSSRTPTPGDRPSVHADQTDGDGSPIYAGTHISLKVKLQVCFTVFLVSAPAMSVCNESSPTPPMLQGLSRSAEELSHVLSTMDLKKKTHRRHGHKGTWGSISRVFSRSRSRRSVDSAGLYEDDKRSSWSPYTSLCASPLAEESYAEKLRLLEEAQNVPIERWKALAVVAWLELSLGMPQYSLACAENIKSGKILLELTDSELDSCLGMSNPMHRKKLRLAVEEFRDPNFCRYPKIGELSHVWVCGEWLPGLGLSQYVDAFANHLVDGRVLEQLGRKELEKYLGVSRKFHQISILHGIQLLRMISYDKQILTERRSQCEIHDSDPLVWTNQRFIKWATSIDLGEYAENLRESGVHGAFVILEPTFTADTMAAALGIPQSKNIIRRHLTTELEALIQPARCSLDQEIQPVKLSKKGNNFSRSYASGLQLAKSSETTKSSLRGSLSRALGLKVKRDLRVMTLPPPVPRHTTTGQTSVTGGGHHEKVRHRRVRSTSDFDAMTVTSV
uniref:SAM domain-containing protein n=1 Tax=Strigamia maritima TaxID=126957 RepID=T1IL73_STRMM